MAGNGSDSLDPKDFGDFPKNLLEFTDQFATDDDCREYLIRLRFRVRCQARSGKKLVEAST